MENKINIFLHFNYYNINEIIEHIENRMEIKITPQLKCDILNYRKPIPKKIIKIMQKNYNDLNIKYFGKIPTEKEQQNYDKTEGIYYSSIIHNGKRGL